MATKAPIESKLYAALIGGAVGLKATGLLLWVVGVYLFNGPRNATGDAAARAAVPTSIADAIGGIVTLGCLFLAGYLANHTPRPLAQVTDVDAKSDYVDVGNDTAEEKVDDNFSWTITNPVSLPPVAHAEHLLSPTEQVKLTVTPAPAEDPEKV
jgi:hypothetical protein